MIGYILISFVIGIALGYVGFHYRYADTRMIDDLRNSLSQVREKLSHISTSEKELSAQNTILKRKTEQLLMQNEDYSKMISKLSRYYFHIKEANQKIDDLKKILQVFDDDLEHQLGDVNEGIKVDIDVPKDLGSGMKSEKVYF